MTRTRFAVVAALTGLMALAACDRPSTGPEAPAAAAFAHDLPEDVSGYYIPTEEVRIDNWRLHHVFMGQVPDFIAWQGGERPAGFAPVMIEFEDMVGPPLESGNRRRLRLIPAAYDVTEDRVRVQALSGGLGAVSFDGRLDQGALATARRNLGDRGVVLKGTLKVGNRTFNNVSMRWWAGD